MDSIYLDANATTRLDPLVRDDMLRCADVYFANPSSQHRMGQLVRRQIELCRQKILSLLGAAPGMNLVFTSGGTEANNLAIQGIALRADASRREVLISAIEHPSVVGAANFLISQGFTVRSIPVDATGTICWQSLETMVNEKTAIVSSMFVNNETGIIQPASKIACYCSEKNVPFHCDAVQTIGKIEVHFSDLANASIAIAPHKFHGPRGIGGLLLPAELPIQPLLFGGFQQLGIRPGTEDISLVTGFTKAVEIAVQGLQDATSRMQKLRDQLESAIQSECPDVVIHGLSSERAPHVSNLSFPGINRQALLMALDHRGVAVSTGSACASGSSEPSPVLQAMGLNSDLVEGSIRISLSRLTETREIELATRHILNAVNHLRQSKTVGK